MAATSSTNNTTTTTNTNNTNNDTTNPGPLPPGGGDGGEMPDPGDIVAKQQAAMAAMMAAQGTIQLMGMKSQLVTAGLNIAGQTVGATTAMAVQAVTDLVKTSKDAVKAQGEAFQKAN